MKIKCIAVDDEPLALEMIQKAVGKVDCLDLVQSFQSVSKALKYLAENTVDCIFLDIEMPDLSGLEFSKIINQFINKPEIVFVTAYPQYVIKEYQIKSVGFLLKPFSFDDFNNVVEKVKNGLLLRRLTEDKIEPFFIKIEAEQVKIIPQKVLYLESLGDYVKIFLENERKPVVPLITLKRLKTYLPKSLFVQINRSQIVNFQKIDSYTTSRLSIDGKDFCVSNSFREEFEMIKKLVL